MLDVLGIDGERVVNFGEDRQGAAQDDRIVVGVPGPGGEDDLVAGTDFQGRHGGVEGRRPGRHADRVLDANVLRIGLLELQDFGVPVPPAERILRFEHLQQFLLLDVVVELRPVRAGTEPVLAHRLSSVDGELFLAFGRIARHRAQGAGKDRRRAHCTHRLQKLATIRHWLVHQNSPVQGERKDMGTSKPVGQSRLTPRSDGPLFGSRPPRRGYTAPTCTRKWGHGFP